MDEQRLNPDPLPETDNPNQAYKPGESSDTRWIDQSPNVKPVLSPGHSTIPYDDGKAKEEPVYAFHSGIGDHDDLMVKKPESENVIEQFKLASRLKGKRKHESPYYPEIPFEYGIHYKGDKYDDYNEQPFKHRVDAYPAKTIEYTITETDPQKTQRNWKIQLEAAGRVRKDKVEYAVNWEGLVAYTNVQNASQLFTVDNGNFVGPGPKENSWHISGSYVKEIDNRSHMHGIIAKDFYNWDNYEAEFEFKCIKSTGIRNDPYAKLLTSDNMWVLMPGVDADIIGIIFKAKSDNKNFYIFLWEGQNRVMSSWRAKSFNGYNCLTGNITGAYSHDKAEAEYRKYMSSSNQAALGISATPGTYASASEIEKWNNWCHNAGWGDVHYKLYKVTNGVMKEVKITPKGNKKGWIQDWWSLDWLNRVKVRIIGRRVKIYTQSYKSGDFDDDNYQLAFDFTAPTGFETGSVGLATFSQSVEFHSIRITKWNSFSGRVPSSGYDSWDGVGSKTLSSTGEDYCHDSALAKAKSLTGNSKPAFELTKVTPEVKDKTKGYCKASLTGPVTIGTYNPKDAGQLRYATFTKSGTATILPTQISPNTAQVVVEDAVALFNKDVQNWWNKNPDIIRIESKIPTLVEPTHKNDDDWDFDNYRLTLWNSKPPIKTTQKSFTTTVFAYEGEKRVMNLWEVFPDSPYATYTLEVKPETLNPKYDSIEIRDKKVYVKTTEWYKGIYPADIPDSGIVTSESDVYIHIPPMPEHYVDPDTGEVMYHGYENVHFLLNQIEPAITKDIWMWFESDPSQNTKDTLSPINAINHKPIIKTDKINDRVVIHCKKDPRYIPWVSGKYIGYGKVNGKRPFLSGNKGKADMVNVPTDVVFIPDGIVNLSDPIIDISDNRVKYKINDDKTVTFYSDYMEMYQWSTPWESQWFNQSQVYSLNSDQILTIDNLPALNPFDDPTYDVDHIEIDSIETTTDNPFVTTWTELSEVNKEKLQYNFKVTANIHYPSREIVDLQNFTSQWKIWNEGVSTDDIGDWHGPPEQGYPEITNIRNQNLRSGWYNPNHQDFTDYAFSFKVQARQGDDDMYGAMFRYHPTTHNFYSFEWDAVDYNGGYGINGMAIYRNICLNPEDYGVKPLKYQKTRLAYDPQKWGFNQHLIHQVEISVIGNKIQVWVDGILKLQATDNDPKALSKGAWGPITASQPYTYFWDLQFTKFVTLTLTKTIQQQWSYPIDQSQSEKEQIIVENVQSLFENEISQIPASEGDITYVFAISDDNSKYPVSFLPSKSQTTTNPASSIGAVVPTRSVINYTVYAKIKENRPKLWSPMIHNGYYYFHEKEHYLFAQPIDHTYQLNPNQKSLVISPRPQQGAPIIIQDNQGNTFRKVAFYDDNWNLTLTNTEVFNGNGYSKYYLQYKDIDGQTLKVWINDQPTTDFIWDASKSSLQFMRTLHQNDTIKVQYQLLNSFMVDMNYDIEEDKARIQFHDAFKATSIRVIYEGSTETPFYRANEMILNPILTHNHRGFLYLTDKTDQEVKSLSLTVSPDRLPKQSTEPVLMTIKVKDQHHNPVSNKKVTLYLDDTILTTLTTNEAGEAYYFNSLPSLDTSTHHIKATCDGIEDEVIFSFYDTSLIQRNFIELKASKSSVVAGTDDTLTVYITLRDNNWDVLTGQKVHVSYVDTKSAAYQFDLNTDAKGQAQFNISGLNQVHGTFPIKVSYNNGTEQIENLIYVKCIGG